MSRFTIKSRDLWLVVGILGGVAAGFGLSRSAPVEPFPLFAASAHGSGNLSMATTPVESGLEMLVLLDHATGELTGYVHNQINGKFFAKFTYADVGKDLGVNKSKKPKYIMVTGQTQFRPSGGSNRPGECVVFVAEEGSGSVVAYGVPWNVGRKATTQLSQRKFVLLDKGPIGSGVRRGAGRRRSN